MTGLGYILTLYNAFTANALYHQTDSNLIQFDDDTLPKKMGQVKKAAGIVGEAHVGAFLEKRGGKEDTAAWGKVAPRERTDWRRIRHDRRLSFSLNEAKGHTIPFVGE